MRWIICFLLVCFAGLQYRLWVGDGSWEDVVSLQRDIRQQRATNERLTQRNKILETEIRGLKNGLASVEERARSDLGLIRHGETFYILAGKDQQ